MLISPLLLVLQTLPLAAHPSLYFDGTAIPGLRAPVNAAQKELHDTLVAGASYANNDPAQLHNDYAYDMGGALATFAIDCAITGDVAVCDRAHVWLMYIVQLGVWEGVGTDPVDFLESGYISGVSVAYDILSDPSDHLPASARLTVNETKTVQTRLVAEASRLYDQTAAGAHPSWWAGEYLQNHNWEDVSALGLAAIVLNGDVNPDPTCTWLAAVIDDFSRVDALFKPIVDGTWHEGYSYQGSSVVAWLHFVMAFARARLPGAVSCPDAALTPDFAQNPWFSSFAHFRTVGALPGRMHQSILMTGDFFGWASEEVLLALRYAAAHFHDGEAEWLAEQQLLSEKHSTYGYEQLATALEYVVYDATVVATPPTARDLYLADLQGAIARSSYDPEAAVLGVKAGAFGGVANWKLSAAGKGVADINFGHDHDDDLGFWFYARGQWLAPEADGYSTHGHCWAGAPYVWNASFHNTLTVDALGQLGDDDPCRDSADGHVPWTRQASVAAHTAGDGFSYVAMEGLGLYPAELKLDTVARQVLFVDRECVVVRDVLHATTPHTYYWHFHALDQIVRDANSVRAESKNDRALDLAVVAPAAWAMDTASDTLPHGPNANVYIDDDLNISHLRLWNAAPAAETRFLVVMCPTTVSGWGARPTVAPIGDVAQARGFLLTRPDRTEAWLFGDGPTATVNDGGGRSLTGVAGGVTLAADGSASYTIIQGSELTADGHEVLASDAVAGSIEARVSGTKVEVTSDGATQARVLAPLGTTATWNGKDVVPKRDPGDARYVLLGAAAEPPPVGSDGGAPHPSVDGGSGGRVDGSGSGADAGASVVMGGCSVGRAGSGGGLGVLGIGIGIGLGLGLGIRRPGRRSAAALPTARWAPDQRR